MSLTVALADAEAALGSWITVQTVISVWIKVQTVISTLIEIKAMIGRMRRPPSKLVERLVGVSEQVLRPDPALRLEDIAALIGSARATLYYHFSGRDDLVAFLLEENLRVAAETIELAVTTPRPPVVQLRSAITALVGFLGGQPGVCAGLLSFAGATGRLGTLMAAKDAKLATPLRNILDEGAATDQFTFSDSRDAANAILGAALIAMLTRWEDGRATQDPEFQQALTDQLVRSVARA
jgi:TetR/AcrR family transcriptional regulator